MRGRFAADLIEVLQAGRLVPVKGAWACHGSKVLADEALKIASRLREYIQRQPQHSKGLCSWLNRYHDLTTAYCLSTAALKGPLALRHVYIGNGFVDDEPGPTEKRLAFARDLLELLDTGGAVQYGHGLWSVSKYLGDWA